MSTFDGVVAEFPLIRIDCFTQSTTHPGPLACFLSHVHSDHLRGLLGFKSPFIYCSAATKELLLRLEMYPHRMNFAKNILESRKLTYKHLKRLLRPIPVGTPTQIELAPGVSITVTLFDANHCTGAVMFLIQGGGKAILYTGDVRSERWWIDSLLRHPVMIPYAYGQRRLDNIYLDTTFASSQQPYRIFPPKAAGIAEMLTKVATYPSNTVFYFNAWTFGYEECWIALSNFLNTRIHLDRYRHRLYDALADDAQKCNKDDVAPLLGFQLGNMFHPGCLTRDETGIRIHSCERGTQCVVHEEQSTDVVEIVPIITRHQGQEYRELGAGGGQGDLDQLHELELSDVATIGNLMKLCNDKLSDRPDLRAKVLDWLSKSLGEGGQSIRLDTTAFLTLLDGDDDLASDDIPLDRFVMALEAMIAEKRQDKKAAESVPARAKVITFPYSRHSSYEELRQLVQALRPRALFPNTVAPDLDMEDLFGDLLRDPSASEARPSKGAHDDQAMSPSRTVVRAQTAKRPRAEHRIDRQRRNQRSEAADAARGINGMRWGVDVELTSVYGYHNEGKEEEL